jgi:hypothetical protein
MRRVHGGVRGHRGGVDQVDVAQHEHPFPGHEHVVEEDDGIHLLEARSERVIEVRPAEVEALAAQEPQSGRAARDGEVQREWAVAEPHVAHARGVHRDLVGQWAERGEDARAPDDDARVPLADDGERGPFLEVQA